MEAVGRYLRNDADLCGRRFFFRQPGVARSQFGGVRSGVGDCVPYGWIFRRVSVSWLPPVHLDYGYRVLVLGNPALYYLWLRSSRRSGRKLDGRSDGGAVLVFSLFFAGADWESLVCLMFARPFFVWRNIYFIR